jgi:hypothetical protein
MHENLVFFLNAYGCKLMCDIYTYLYMGRDNLTGIANGYGLTVRGSNPGAGDIFHTCPYRPWVPPNLLYRGYRVISGRKEAAVWR